MCSVSAKWNKLQQEKQIGLLALVASSKKREVTRAPNWTLHNVATSAGDLNIVRIETQ
jgi:hypothetical protein